MCARVRVAAACLSVGLSVLTAGWLPAVCPEPVETEYGRDRSNDPLIARGLPKLQIRLVYDETKYPPNWHRRDYYPQLFVDEFWLTDDQLIKLNQVRCGAVTKGRWLGRGGERGASECSRRRAA
eukprot:SAG22_NODE_1274_length_4921_cov_4.998548_4_plen_124_part_00